MGRFTRGLRFGRSTLADAVTIRAIVDAAMADDALDAHAEHQLMTRLAAHGWSWERYAGAFPDAAGTLRIARINAGRLAEVAVPAMVPRYGEVVHVEAPARLAAASEDTARRHGRTRGGLSFRPGRGERFRPDQFFGHEVPIGAGLRLDDVGVLSITSQRTVFQGRHRTVLCAHTKVVELALYHDALEITVTNRPAPAVFWVDEPHIMAATINAALQVFPAPLAGGAPDLAEALPV